MNALEFKRELNQRIFWDVDFAKMDVDKNHSFVIERIFDRGDVQDIRSCRRYYSEKLTKEVLLEAKSLRLPRIYLASAIIDQPITEFRCYKERQLNPGLSIY